MYQSPLRQLFSRKLFLSMAIVYILSSLISFLWLYFMSQSTVATQMGQLSRADQIVFSSVMNVLLIFILALVLGAGSLPMISCFMIHSKARSGKPFTTGGFTVFKSFLIFLIVVLSLSLPWYLAFLRTSLLRGLLSLVTQGICFASVILLLISVNALKSYARQGYTDKRIPAAAPVFLLLQAAMNFISLMLDLVTTDPALLFPYFLLRCVIFLLDSVVLCTLAYFIAEARKVLHFPEIYIAPQGGIL